jgi:phosphoglycolate phosphatase
MRKTASPIRAVIFDKDGVLVDFERTWTPVITEAARRFAHGDETRARELLMAVGYDPGSGTFAPGSVWAAGTNDDLLAVWAPEADENTRREFLAMMASLCEARTPVPVCPPQAMHKAVSRLRRRGLLAALVTNDTTASARRALAHFGLEDLFAFVCGFDRVARPKPAPDPVFAFAEACGIAPAEMAVIGDNRHDAEMARAAGCGLIIGVLSGTSDRAALKPHVDLVLPDMIAAADHIAALCDGRRNPRELTPRALRRMA